MHMSSSSRFISLCPYRASLLSEVLKRMSMYKGATAGSQEFWPVLVKWSINCVGCPQTRESGMKGGGRSVVSDRGRLSSSSHTWVHSAGTGQWLRPNSYSRPTPYWLLSKLEVNMQSRTGRANSGKPFFFFSSSSQWGLIFANEPERSFDKRYKST